MSDAPAFSTSAPQATAAQAALSIPQSWAVMGAPGAPVERLAEDAIWVPARAPQVGTASHGDDVGPDAGDVIVFLHGYAADIDQMGPVAAAVRNADASSDLLAVDAPLSLPMQHVAGRMWFELNIHDHAHRRAGARAAAAHLQARLEDLIPRLRRPGGGRLTLVGYSQGGMVALEWAAALGHRGVDAGHRLHKIVCINACLAAPSEPLPAAGGAHGAIDATLVNGTADVVIPIGDARASVAALTAAGHKAGLVSLEGAGHGLREAVIAAAAQAGTA